MKQSFLLFALWSVLYPLHAEDPAFPRTEIIGPIADGSPSPPAAKPTLPNFEVERTIVRRVRVKESPELPGLPPVEGTINVTLQMVKDPQLPEPPPPLPPLPADDPAVRARIAEFQENHQMAEFAFVSATVFNHSRTFLRFYPAGKAAREFAVWSNIDFNSFSGFSSYQVKDADGAITAYSLIMGVGPSGRGREGIPPIAAALPDLASGGPAYVVTEGDTSDAKEMRAIDGMHELYRVEGARMEAAYHARLAAFELRKAFLLAHPPSPKDVTIHFWKRNIAPAAPSDDEGKQEQ